MPKIVFFLCLLVLSQNAVANTIITCGPNAGHAFYFPGIIVKAKDAGWHKDGTKDGKTALTVNGKQIDVLFADATGNLNSAISTGGQVVVLGESGPWVTVLVNYPKKTVELYTFNLQSKTYAMSSHKYGESPIQKAATFTGKCF